MADALPVHHVVAIMAAILEAGDRASAARVPKTAPHLYAERAQSLLLAAEHVRDQPGYASIVEGVHVPKKR
jgi:hypothetical protein